MAVTVGKLYKEATKYEMDYLAGEEGFGNIVTWVHVIETVDGAAFLHGQEVVLTTCVGAGRGRAACICPDGV